MPAQIHCPHCGQVFGLTDEQVPQYAGQTINCTRCGKSFTVAADLGAQQPTAPPRVPQGPPTTQYQSPRSPYAHQEPPQGNGMAVASLVCGAIGLIPLFIPSVLAIIFGILGIRRTRDPMVGGKGLAIAGISLGGAGLFICVVIMPCMIAILLPSLNRARETANRVKCASNMKSIAQAMLAYSSENRGAHPARLEDLITAQYVTPEIFVCPSCNDTPADSAQNLSAGGHLSYIYLGRGLNNATTPNNMVLLYEPLTNHDQDGFNVLYGDGSVYFHPRAEAERIFMQLQSGRNPPGPRRP